MVLWIIFAGLTAAAMAAVLCPLLLHGKRNMEAESYDAEVFKDQLDEIISEKERGVISKADSEAARTEVSRRLLAATRTSDKGGVSSSDTPGGRAPAMALLLTFIFVPVTSAAIYLVYGSPGLPDSPLAPRLQNASNSKNVGALVARVEARLRGSPEDGRGWEVLAPVYIRLRRYDDAAEAYGNVLRLLGETPQRLVEYGNALVLSNDGIVPELARKALLKAAAADGSLVRAKFWLAVAQEQDGLYSQAAEAWRDILKRSEEDAPWREAVQQRLAMVEQRAGAISSEKSAAVTSPKPNADITKESGQNEVAAVRDMSASNQAALITQMVAGLSERLRSEGGNIEEWKRLVRSYSVLGIKQEAVKALADARGAFTEDPKSLASLNELASSLGL